MSDLIDRQETIKEIKELAKLYPYKVEGDRESYSRYNEAWSDCVDMAESAVMNQLTVEAIPIAYIEKYMQGWSFPFMLAFDKLINSWRKES